MPEDNRPSKVRGIKKLVDDAYRLDREIKARQKVLDSIKIKVRQHARAINSEVIKGSIGKARLSPYTSSSVDPERALSAVENSLSRFLNIVKINISDFKREVGKSASEDYIEKVVSPMHSVSFLAMDDPIEPDQEDRLTRSLNISQED